MSGFNIFDFSLAKVQPGCLPAVALSLSIIVGQASAAEALSFRDGIKEGDRRLESKQYELAEGCYRQALRDAKRDPSAAADDRALCMQKLAAVLQLEDISQDALPLYKKAIKELRRAHGPHSETLLPPLRALGLVEESDGDFKKALKTYRQALEIATDVGAKASPAAAGAATLRLADCEHSLGRTASKDGDAGLALSSYRQALALYMGEKSLPSSEPLQELVSDYTDLLEKKYGPGKTLPSSVRNELLKDRLADLSQRRGVAPSSFEKEVTVRLAREAMDKVPPTVLNGAEKVEAPEPVPLPSRNDIVGDESIGQQKIAFYERMIAVDVKSLGPEHPSVARDLSGLGAVYMAAGKYDDAKVVLMRALKIYETTYGADALMVKRTRSMLELVSDNQIAAQGGDNAGTNFIASLPAVPLSAQRLDLSISLSYLASLLYSLGRVEEAETVYGWAVADTYYTTGERSLLLAAALKDYARVLRTRGNNVRAELLESDARAITRRVLSQQAAGAYQ